MFENTPGDQATSINCKRRHSGDVLYDCFVDFELQDNYPLGVRHWMVETRDVKVLMECDEDVFH